MLKKNKKKKEEKKRGKKGETSGGGGANETVFDDPPLQPVSAKDVLTSVRMGCFPVGVPSNLPENGTEPQQNRSPHGSQGVLLIVVALLGLQVKHEESQNVRHLAPLGPQGKPQRSSK